jgi:protein SCO1/2
MDHTSLVYLMDRDGRFVTHFTPNGRAEDMVNAIRLTLAKPVAPAAPPPPAQ